MEIPMCDYSKLDEKTKRWLAKRIRAAAHIDPATAEVDWRYGQTVDPYGIYDELSPDEQQVQRHYFARAPASKIWVCFDDLPKEVYDELWKRHRRKLAFPSQWHPD